MFKKNTNNPFRKNNFNKNKSKEKSDGEEEEEEINWGAVKFNPVARNAVIERATPWSNFKDQIIKNQQNHQYEADIDNVDSKEILKKREENYRKNLIESKRNQPTKWEDFSDEEGEAASSSNANKSEKLQGKFQQIPSVIKNIDSIKKNEFDSKLLTQNQNNYLKKFITKKHFDAKKGSLRYAIEDMKANGVVRERDSSNGKSGRDRGFDNKKHKHISKKKKW